MLDIRDLSGHVTFVVIDDSAGHFVRQKPVIGRHHTDDGNVDVGEYVDRRPQAGQRSEDRNEEGEHHKGVGPPQRDLHDPHVRNLPSTDPVTGELGRTSRRGY